MSLGGARGCMSSAARLLAQRPWLTSAAACPTYSPVVLHSQEGEQEDRERWEEQCEWDEEDREAHAPRGTHEQEVQSGNCRPYAAGTHDWWLIRGKKPGSHGPAIPPPVLAASQAR